MSASLARATRRIPPTGSPFIRTLAALDDAAAVHEASAAFAPRLAGWLAWTDAFKLSAALGGTAPCPDAPGPGGHAALAADERELACVRTALATAIAEATPNGTGPRRAGRVPAAAEPPIDFALIRQRYARCQLAMETRIVPLRRRLRASLAGRSAALARLAELDSVMEQVVGARERMLLAGVAARLEPRFDALRAAPDAAATPPGPWLTSFHREMRGLLLAELDLRLQPVAGLLEACRQSLCVRS